MTTDERAGLLSSLRHRDYRLLMAAFTVSTIGSWAYNVALTVWVYEATGSLGWVAAITVARYVPALVLSPYAGVLADRLEKVSLMGRVDLAFAGLMAAVAVLMGLDAPVVSVLAVAALCSTLGTVYEPAAAGLTPLVVPERDLASANALRGTVDNLAVIVGPGLGGLLLVAGPLEVSVWINAATFAASAVLVLAIRTRSTAVDVTDGGSQGPLQQMTVGIRAIFSAPSVAVMVGYCLLTTLVYGVDTVLFVAASDRLLGTGADGFGYLLAGLGLGGVIGAPLVTRAESRSSLGPVILVGMAGYCLPLLVLLVNHDPVMAFACQVVRGVATLVVDVLAVTALQRALPSDVLARVFGAFNALVLLAILLGAASTSLLLAGAGLSATIWVAGAGYFGLSLLGVPWLRQMDHRARARRDELAPRIALIEGCDLFARVPDGGLAQLAGTAQSVSAASGSVIVRQGERADAFYIVESGILAVEATAVSSERVALPQLGAGDYFGEIGLLEQIPRTADVVATTDVRLLRIDGAAFIDALTSGTPSAAFLDGAAVRLGRTHPASALHRAALPQGDPT